MSAGLVGLIVWLIAQAIKGRDRSQEPVNYSLVVAMILWAIVGGLMVVWLRQLYDGDLSTLPKLACGLVVLFPWSAVQLIAMPLGLVRTAYYVSFLCLLRFKEDRRGAALLVAARTLLRLPASDRSTPQFVEKRLTRIKQMRGAAVVAMGLLTVQRGESDAAHALLQSAWNLHPAACPPWALAQAGEWLLVEAVAEGDWKQVSELTGRLELDTALTRLLRACAARFIHTDSSPLTLPGPVTLYYRWLRAPYQSATWPLVQRALRSQPAPKSDPAAAAAPSVDKHPADLAAALRELAALLDVPKSAITEDLLLRVCQTWETALQNPQTERQITERALTLGHQSAGTIRGELRAQVAATVAARLRESGLPLGRLRGDGTASNSGSDVAAIAAQSVRTQLLEEIEQACSALHDRTADKRALPTKDEWAEWATLRARYQRVCNLGGVAVRRLAWATFHREVCGWAVWLWNDRKEKILGNAVFRFLLSEAEELSDESRITLDRKNVDCGI